MTKHKKGGKGNNGSNTYSKAQLFFMSMCWLLVYVSQAQQKKFVITYALNTYTNYISYWQIIWPSVSNLSPLSVQSLPLVPVLAVPCFTCPPLFTAEDKLILSNRFLLTKSCLCGRNITLCHRLLWISTGAQRWRGGGEGRSRGCSPNVKPALGWFKRKSPLTPCWTCIQFASFQITAVFTNICL